MAVFMLSIDHVKKKYNITTKRVLNYDVFASVCLNLNMLQY